MLIIKIINLRLLQALRFIRETGFILLIALLVSVGFILQIIDAIRSLNWVYILGIGAMLVISIHFSRKDLRFLSKITSRNIQMRLILLAEYLLMLSPLILLFLITGPWQNGLALCLTPLVALALPMRSFYFTERKQKRALKWVPIRLFELKLHIEKNKLGYALLYVLSLLSPFHIAFFILGIFFLSTMIMTAFSVYEPKELLHWENRFLKKKIQQNGLFIAKIMAPTFALAFVFHFAQWPLLLYLLLIPLLTTFFGLLYKYARLTPIFQQPPNSSILTMFLLLLFLPGGILIHLGYSIVLLRKAQKNLLYYYA